MTVRTLLAVALVSVCSFGAGPWAQSPGQGLRVQRQRCGNFGGIAEISADRQSQSRRTSHQHRPLPIVVPDLLQERVSLGPDPKKVCPGGCMEHNR